MNGIMNLLKAIDLAIFNQIDNFKDSKYYEQLMDFMSQLSEGQQKLFKYAFSIFIIIPPAIVVVVLAINLLFLESTLDTKKEIHNNIYKFNNQKGRLLSLQRKVLNPKAPKTKNELKNSLQSIGIDQKKLVIRNFKQKKFPNAPKIKQINADIIFKKIALGDFVGLIKKLIKVNKMRINGVEINRDSKTKLLSGKVSVLQYIKK